MMRPAGEVRASTATAVFDRVLVDQKQFVIWVDGGFIEREAIGFMINIAARDIPIPESIVNGLPDGPHVLVRKIDGEWIHADDVTGACRTTSGDALAVGMRISWDARVEVMSWRLSWREPEVDVTVDLDRETLRAAVLAADSIPQFWVER